MLKSDVIKLVGRVWYTMWTVKIVISLCNVRHMWHMVQVEPGTSVPYRAHDVVKVLICPEPHELLRTPENV